MATVSERARKLADAMRTADIPIVEDSDSIVAIQAQYTAAYCQLIEQALLAERRLAMEEAAKICDEFERMHVDSPHIRKASRLIGRKLRAAAEKEVGTK
jgi:hypothetical protein